MKMTAFFLLIIMFTGLNVAGYAETSVPADYCYKPNKPLFFATRHHKSRYTEDMEEYQRCVKSFVESQDRVDKMQQQSVENSRIIWNKFVEHQ